MVSCPLPFAVRRGGQALGFGIGTKGQDDIMQRRVGGAAVHELAAQENDLGVFVFKPRLELIDKITARTDPALPGRTRL